MLILFVKAAVNHTLPANPLSDVKRGRELPPL
jgi:hypothetical protein